MSSGILDLYGLDNIQDDFAPAWQDAAARLDEYPGAEDAKRIGSVIPNLNHPSSKQRQSLKLLQGPGLVEEKSLAPRQVQLVQADEKTLDPVELDDVEEKSLLPPAPVKMVKGKEKKVPVWGYNISYILITQVYIPKDESMHKKGMDYIEEGKKHFQQLEVVVALTKKIKALNKDKPQKIDFEQHPEVKELLKKASELGFADKDKLVYSDKELDLLLSDLDTQAKILPQRAQIAFNMVPTITEKQMKIAEIVRDSTKIEKDLIQRAMARSTKGGHG